MPGTRRPGRPAKKRAPGDARVFRRASDGLWVGRIPIGRLPSGALRYLQVTAATEGECVARRDEKRRELAKHGRVVARDKAGTTLKEYLELVYLPTRAPGPGASGRTHASYTYLADHDVTPVLGGVLMGELVGEHLSALYAQLGQTQTARNVHQFLHVALKAAVRWGYCAQNPADQTDPPRYRTPEREPPTREQVGTFLADAEAAQDWYLGAWVLAGLCGLRPSEARGAAWGDVAWRDRRLWVERANSDPRSATEPHRTKTRRGRRSVPLTDEALRLLGLARARQRAAGLGWRDTDPVVVNRAGVTPNMATVGHFFTRAWRDRSGLPERFTLYSLRHAWVTELLAEEVPLHEVSWVAGHASAAFTADRYGHRVARRDDALRQGIGRAFDPAKPVKGVEGAP